MKNLFNGLGDIMEIHLGLFKSVLGLSEFGGGNHLHGLGDMFHAADAFDSTLNIPCIFCHDSLLPRNYIYP
jgi:hypothetical protein